MRLDFYATQEGYAHHLIPVWQALPQEVRGTFFGHTVNFVRWLQGRGVVGAQQHERTGNPVLTAGVMDYRRAGKRGPAAQAYMEHGCGQSYAGDQRMSRHGAYAGGDGRDGCSLILAPNAFAAARWAERYPETPVHVIGAARVLPPPEDAGRPLLVVSFHWSGAQVPEMRNGFSHYADYLGALRQEVPLALHAHPRARDGIRAWAHRLGITFISDVEEVARRATVYAVDNSSTLWELGRTRPTIALNIPAYRRDVDHGLRFWAQAGVQVDGGEELIQVARRLVNGGESDAERAAREARVRAVIPRLDGAQTAATILSDWLRNAFA